MLNPLIELKDVSVHYDQRAILHKVSLTIKAGEIVSLIGPNGAGKTTLVKVVLGLVKPDQGHVIQAPHNKVGYMPQRLVVSPLLPLTVRDFLSCVTEDNGAIAHWLARLRIEKIADQTLQSLSGGEWQRVLLARSLIRRPTFLVLDEPAQSIDIAGQSEVYKLLAQIRDEFGCAILLVSHDLHYVMQATDRVICFNHHICCQGSPLVVAQDPAFLALYTHKHDHSHDAAGDILPLQNGGHQHDKCS
jgi:zinc transport system ATP-binding protein